MKKVLLLASLKAAAFIIGHLPSALMRALGRTLGGLIFRLDRKRRDIAMSNLDLAYGPAMTPAEKEAVARESFVSLAILALEFMRLPWIDRKSMERFVDCEGREHLDRAIEKGRGVIILTAHFGNWELLGAWLGLMGYRLDVVVRELDSPVMEEFVAWVRTRCGNRIVYKQRSMRKLLRQLAEGGLVGLLIDQNVTWVEGVFVDFFGTPACTNKGASALASSSGAAVVPTFIVRKGARHTVVFGPEVDTVNTGDRAIDMVENTQRFTAAIEQMVRAHPEQWFWVHRRWKTRPKEEGGE